MRLLFAIGMCVCLFAAVNERNERLTVEGDLQSVRSDNADLVKQLDAADKATAAKATAAMSASEDRDKINQKAVEAAAGWTATKSQLAKSGERIAELEKTVADRDGQVLKLVREKEDLTKDIAALEKKPVEPEPPALPDKLAWISGDYPRAREMADKSNRELFIDFGPDWCPQCTRLKLTTFADSAVAKRLKTHFVPLVMGQGPTAEAFDVHRFPTAVIVHRDGTCSKFEPNEDADSFMRQLDKYSDD